jgi:large conductance mechanosensitive channel
VLKEFRDFINRGSVMDLAVAVILGIAFGAVVTSLVDDILMPILGIFIGGVDFSGLAITVGNAVIAYGNFIQMIVNFLIIAFAIFIIVRWVNKLQKEAPAPTPAPSPEEKLLAEIRDLLKQQRAPEVISRESRDSSPTSLT